MRAPFHVTEFQWPDAYQDVAAVPKSADCVRLVSGAKNIQSLKHLANLKALWCFNLNLAMIDLIAQLQSLKYVFVETVRVGGALNLLSQLKDLIVLRIDSCSKENSLKWLDNFPLLDGLGITNFRNVSRIDEIAWQSELRSLAVSGSMWTKMKVDTLRPLSDLKRLEYLDLTSLRVLDESLDPLVELSHLEHLDIANAYPFDEFARLAGRLSNCECSWFKPYQDFSAIQCKRCGKATLVIPSGKRMPMLCKVCDEVRLRKHEERFNAVRDAA